jgi:hypothetical protein
MLRFQGILIRCHVFTEHGKVLVEFFFSTAGRIYYLFISNCIRSELSDYIILPCQNFCSWYSYITFICRKISNCDWKELGSWDFFKKKLYSGQEAKLISSSIHSFFILPFQVETFPCYCCLSSWYALVAAPGLVVEYGRITD